MRKKIRQAALGNLIETELASENRSRRELFEVRAAAMRERMATRDQAVQGTERTYSLAQAAVELGVSYSTARRLCKEHARRYSTTMTGNVVYPGTTLKRFQRVRISYVIEEADIQKIKNLMRGIAA
jgi:hypothetical protein